MVSGQARACSTISGVKFAPIITPMTASMRERHGPGTWTRAPPSEARVVATIAPSIHASGRLNHANTAPPAVPAARVAAARAASDNAT